MADEAAGELAVPVPAADTAQLVMGLAMAVGQIVREAYGDRPLPPENHSTPSASWVQPYG